MDLETNVSYMNGYKQYTFLRLNMALHVNIKHNYYYVTGAQECFRNTMALWQHLNIFKKILPNILKY